jgi:hypothetical protein
MTPADPSPTTPPAAGPRGAKGARLGAVWQGGATLESVLGVGGTATVYLSHVEGVGEVAVKVLHEEWLRDPEILRAFELEADLLGQLQHPGLTTVLGRGRLASGEPWYAMERLKGALLTDVLHSREGTLSIEDTFHIMERTLEVLAYLHGQGVVHRDLKPANLFLTLEGSVKVLDLGAALLLNRPDVPAAERLIGSPSFMAPEQATHATLGVDTRTDVFTVGATMFYLLSGQTVRSAPTVDELFHLASTTPAPSLAKVLPDAPPAVSRLVDRALAWVPADRFADAADMLAALQQAAQESRLGPSALSTAGSEALRAAFGGSVVEADEDLAEGERGAIQKELREFFRKLARVVLALRRYEPETAEFQERYAPARLQLQLCFRMLGGELGLTVRPQALEWEELPVWAPEVGLEDTPYFLFQSGFRAIRILEDVTDNEIIRFCRMLSLDPMRDLPFEDDLSTVFTESRFEGIEAVLLSGFDMDIIDHYETFGQQVSALDRELAEESRRAMKGSDAGMAHLAAALGRQGISEADAIDIQLHQSEGDRIQALWPLDRTPELADLPSVHGDSPWRWRVRGLRTLARGLERAFTDGDPELLLERLKDRLDELQQAALMHEALALLGGLCSQTTPASAALMLDRLCPQELVDRLLAVALMPRADWGGRIYALDPHFALFLARLPARLTPLLLDWWQKAAAGPAGHVFTAEMQRRASRETALLGNILPRAPESVAVEILRWVAPQENLAARQALARAIENPSELVQAAALALLLPQQPQACIPGLEKLLHSDQSRSRRTALKLIDRHRPPGVDALIDRLIHRPHFRDQPLAERQALLVTLHQIAPERARAVLAELVTPGSWGLDAGHATTRTLAAELLCVLYPDRTSLQTVEKEIKRVFRTTADIREHMTRSANTLRARLTAESP